MEGGTDRNRSRTWDEIEIEVDDGESYTLSAPVMSSITACPRGMCVPARPYRATISYLKIKIFLAFNNLTILHFRGGEKDFRSKKKRKEQRYNPRQHGGTLISSLKEVPCPFLS